MRVIFLDIDGVMNSASGKEPYLADMEVSKLELLKKLIADTKSTGIVLTSDRRFSEPYMKMFLDALDNYEILLIDCLRKPLDERIYLDDSRGKQIQDFLNITKYKIDKFVILDDNDDGISNLFPSNFIEVNKYFGLNKEIYDRCKQILL